MFNKAFGIGLAAVLSAAPVGYALAANRAAASKDAITIQLSAAPKKTTVKRTTTVKRGAHTTVKRTTVKKTTVKRAPVVRHTTTVVRKPVVRHTTTVVRKPVVHRTVVVVRRPYRAWARRPYYGAALIGGIALGTVIAVNTAHAVPAAPGPNACWYWSDPAETHGYWDYCTPP